MSRRHKVHQPLNGLLWPVLILAGILLVAAAFLLTSRRGGAAVSDTSGGTPAIGVSEQQIDFGDLKDYTQKSFTVDVTNTGTGTLRFTDKPYVQVLKGCCPPDLSLGATVLAPGESTTVTSSVFMMHPGMDGPHDYAVHLATNDPNSPDLIVHVLSNWGP